MEIEKDCAHYLQSHEVIYILKQPNTLLHHKVFDCLRRHKKYFYKIVPLAHFAIPGDILLMCAEDAFITTQEKFYQNVKNNKFEALKDDCISYVSVIFKRYYLELYKKEVERKTINSVYSANDNAGKSYNEGEKKLDKKDSISLKVQSVLDQLSDEDKRIYHLHYSENMKVKEIAALLNILPHAVTGKLYNFHARFGKAWLHKNKKQS